MQTHTKELIKMKINPNEASRLTFRELNDSLTEILTATELPVRFTVSEDDVNFESLTINDSDREGLMMISRLQERPFDLNTQLFAQKLLDDDPSLKSSLLVFHKMLVDFGEYRLLTLPGRDRYTLVPFEEIFILQNGKVVPNIRFMKILTTNWIPAIARVMLDNGLDKPNLLEASHISKAINEVERQYKLFQLTLFMFNEETSMGGVMYGGHIPKVCPAKKMVSQIGIELLPVIYDKINKGENHE